METPPVPRISWIDPETGLPTSWTQDFLERLLDRTGGSGNKGLVNAVQVTVGQADLASSGEVLLIRAKQKEQWKVRDLMLSGAGTNFSAGGDRLLDIKSGSIVWTTITNATLESLVARRWGNSGMPFPATAADMTAGTSPGDDIVAAYSGGTTDHDAGSLTIILFIEKTG